MTEFRTVKRIMLAVLNRNRLQYMVIQIKVAANIFNRLIGARAKTCDDLFSCFTYYYICNMFHML